ncbi:spore protease YyaC [Paenibacillus sp. LHD-117]|uniref:spore protease YyaC n=1 Tax=Paenibacillus sp. LHD-117 TaxID=3071412 RepID=UPI0027DFCCB1|nr:spore protease YyaC [Paenibacillus sp. LHD-117]MDQ6420083.1 spore protease YyaC [Paenibacillus sp. LHD-117]
MATVTEPMEATGERLASFLGEIARVQPDRKRILFLCVGTDCSTGDAFGPLVGTMLEEHGWPGVIGTLAEPCDAHKVEAAAAAALRLRKDEAATVIAIDACLGKPQSVGGYVLSRGPLKPGAATGRRLPPVGDYGIAGVVNRQGPKAYAMLQTTSLHLVMNMAKQIVSAIDDAWYIHKK